MSTDVTLTMTTTMNKIEQKIGISQTAMFQSTHVGYSAAALSITVDLYSTKAFLNTGAFRVT